MFEIGLIITVVVGVNELIKRVFSVTNRFLPLISLALGVIAGVFYLGGDPKTKIFYGVIIGLSASGLFDQSKIIKKRNEE